jgi:recombination protein RecT|tara:strand:+ start:1836 stop:2705 length:870 start_codon:yes stop_codon:yes gene_type:complete
MTELQKAKERSVGLTNNQTSLKETIKGGEFYIQIANALPQGNLSAKRYISACLTALAVQPKLMQCKPSSVLKSMMESARYGLEPNSPLSEAALIPFGQECTFLIEYRGMMKLAWNTGLIKTLDYDKVCEGDEFDYSKSSDGLLFFHRPSLSASRGEGSIYYAYAELKHGGTAFQVMTRDDIVAHAKQFSRGYSSKSSPWQTDFDAMAYKTVIRQLCDKKLPKSTTENGILMNEAAHIDDFVEEPRHTVMQEKELEVVDIDTNPEISSSTPLPDFDNSFDPAEQFPQEED